MGSDVQRGLNLDRRLSSIIILVLVCLGASRSVFAGQVTLSWDSNTEPDLAGYRLYYGASSRSYSRSIDVGKVTIYTISGLEPGTYFFAVTAYNTAHLESGFSNEVSTAIPPPRPATVRLNTATAADGLAQVAVIVDPGSPPATEIEFDLKLPASLSWISVGAVYADQVIEAGPVSGGIRIRISGVGRHAGVIALLRLAISSGTPAGMLPLVVSDIRATPTDGESPSSEDGRIIVPAASMDVVSPSQVQATFFYPRGLAGGTADPASIKVKYVGIAMVNLDSASAAVRISAIDNAGLLVSGTGITNPMIVVLKPGEQFALLESELLGAPINGSGRGGYAKVESTSSKVSGFFMMFKPDLTSLDGAEFSADPQTMLIFEDPAANPPGNIQLINPAGVEGQVRFDLVRSDGTVRGSTTRHVLPYGALAAGLADELYPGLVVATSDYLRIESNTPLVGFAMSGREGADARIVKLKGGQSGATKLYCPRYVSGDSWDTSIIIVNIDPGPGTVQARFSSDDSTGAGASYVCTIEGNGKILISAEDLFGASADQVHRGHLEITSSGPKLAGTATFGNPTGDGFSSALPLTSETATAVALAHAVSNRDLYTGIAIVNASSTDGSAKISLFRSDGTLEASTAVALPHGRGVARLLTQFFPALGERDITGYVRITSDVGVVALALFGRTDLSVLSAIPANAAR